MSADDLDDKWRKYIITKTMYERQEEFKRLIDIDHNGKANRSELLSYVDPRHPRHALTEAANLFSLADENNDQRLVLDEVCGDIARIWSFANDLFLDVKPCRVIHQIKSDIDVREFPR